MSSVAHSSGLLSQPGLYVWKVTVAVKAIAYTKPMGDVVKGKQPETPRGIYTFLVTGSPAKTHDELLEELHRMQIPIVQKINGRIMTLSQFLILTKRED